MPLPSRLFCALILLVLVSNGFAGSKYQVIHAFAGGATDGSVVASPLLVSKNGNVIGVTNFGGSLTDCYSNGCGTIFSLSQINGPVEGNRTL